MARSFYTNEEIDFIKEYYPIKGTKYCSKKLGRTISSVRTKANDIGLKVNKEAVSKIHSEYRLSNPYPEKKPEEYKVNPDAFIKNITKETAYILGLIWADGCINKQSIRIECLKKDVLIFLPTFLKTGKWRRSFRSREGRREQGTIYTNNKILSEYLISCGYGPHTFNSADKILDIIPDELKHLWFRGLIDGDGCWYINKKLGLRQFSLAGSYEQDWTYFTNLLDNLEIKYNIQRRKQIQNGRENKSSCVRITGKENITKFGQYIYSSFIENNIGLKRKYDKYFQIINSYNSILNSELKSGLSA